MLLSCDGARVDQATLLVIILTIIRRGVTVLVPIEISIVVGALISLTIVIVRALVLMAILWMLRIMSGTCALLVLIPIIGSVVMCDLLMLVAL
jgi:hypothetical protein